MSRLKNKIYTADRREGDLWVFEDENGKNYSVKNAPEGTVEGAKLIRRRTGFVLLSDGEEERKEMRKKMDELFGKKKTENYKFINHSECEFFPCHKTDRPEDFNCLFCYCPLFALGDDCGGNFTYTQNGYKDCSNCLVPHRRENYDYVNKKLMELYERMKKKEK